MSILTVANALSAAAGGGVTYFVPKAWAWVKAKWVAFKAKAAAVEAAVAKKV